MYCFTELTQDLKKIIFELYKNEGQRANIGEKQKYLNNLDSKKFSHE